MAPHWAASTCLLINEAVKCPKIRSYCYLSSFAEGRIGYHQPRSRRKKWDVVIINVYSHTVMEFLYQVIVISFSLPLAFDLVWMKPNTSPEMRGCGHWHKLVTFPSVPIATTAFSFKLSLHFLLIPFASHADCCTSDQSYPTTLCVL